MSAMSDEPTKRPPAERTGLRATKSPRKINWSVKFAAAVVVVSVFGFLFLRSVRSSRAEPYVIAAESLRGWTLELAPPSGPNSPL